MHSWKGAERDLGCWLNARNRGLDWGLCVQAGYELAGRYVLEELLGQGAVGEVWRAADRELDRLVAVKVIRERVADPKLAAGLLAEARIAGRLQHPGITVVHDAGVDQGQPFLVMELLEGRDL